MYLPAFQIDLFSVHFVIDFMMEVLQCMLMATSDLSTQFQVS
jgi:hypothetical protein